MSYFVKSLILVLSLLVTHTTVNAADLANNDELEVTTVELKYVTGEDVLSVISSLIDKSVSVTNNKNLLIIKGAENKTKTLLHIIDKIDTPPSNLTIEFIASNRKIDFNSTSNCTFSWTIAARRWCYWYPRKTPRINKKYST